MWEQSLLHRRGSRSISEITAMNDSVQDLNWTLFLLSLFYEGVSLQSPLDRYVALAILSLSRNLLDSSAMANLVSCLVAAIGECTGSTRFCATEPG